MSYHQPVLLKASVDLLDVKKSGCYVDVTYGGGGHSAEILKRLGDSGSLYGIDQDADAAANVLSDSRFHFLQGNFRYLKSLLKLEGVKSVDGILADLGVSSHQFDEAERGFSYRFESQLDMRMNRGGERTAANILNEYDVQKLQQIFGEYGEVRNAKTLAQAVVAARRMRPIQSVGDFLTVLEPCIRGQKLRYLSQVFQALRIEVNEELEVLKEFLNQSIELLKPGGRLVIISYHSLEDRIVKNFFKTGNTEGRVEKDFYGNIHRPFELITKKAVEPDDTEIRQNSRARSARLRAASKIEV